jgi:cyclopropane fatty-acyl-phospholipid synthase-like methyltransferase
MNSKYIHDYYDYCHKDFKRIWHLDRCMAMHMGFWDNGTKRLRDALLKENVVLAKQAGVSLNDRVLDAGCGVGGSSIFLAKNYGCNVTGITVSTQQVRYAREYAQYHDVYELINFFVADYTNIPFSDGSFDVIWGIESICHADNKMDFLKEAYRLLRKGGRIIVADGFRSRRCLNKEEEALLKKSFRGWGVGSLEVDEVFHGRLKELGFRHIKEQDVTSLIYKSSRRLYLYSFPAHIIDMTERLFKKRGSIEQGNVISARNQFISLNKGLWSYKVFFAEK